MQQVWQTRGFLEFAGHVRPTLLRSSGVPQGCPLAPLTLACWMSSGIAAVNHLVQTQGGYSAVEAARAKVRVYMDDRSWVDSDYQRCLSRGAIRTKLKLAPSCALTGLTGAVKMR